ncbi:MAG TPA: glycosyltransferase [Thermoanaerobaculia bacterium]|nr:glycosyltransferase [Thermoanaerobaculia bacterium]
MMRIAVLTPLPPVRSGIAGYAELLLPALARHANVVAVVDQPSHVAPAGVEVIGIDRFRAGSDQWDAVIGQMGNNPYHDFIWEEAVAKPMYVVLHDLVLHHLIVERTLAKDDAAGYEQLVRASHGEPAAAFARGRALGFHGEIGNFLFPSSSDLARRSKGVIVHNEWAGRRLREEGVESPIIVTGHPVDQSAAIPSGEERRALRERLGVLERERLIGIFGFVTDAKRPAAIFEAFGLARRKEPGLRLLVVGEPAPNIDLRALAKLNGLPDGSWIATGYVADEEFDLYLSAADRVISLRYPSAGEMSGPLIRAFRIGRPVAVSAVAQFAELPSSVAEQIPIVESETEALAHFMVRDFPAGLGESQQQWLREHASLEGTVSDYLRALRGDNDIPEIESVSGSIPLLIRFDVERFVLQASGGDVRLSIRLRSRSDTLFRAAAYGEPALRFVLKGFDEDRMVFDRWLQPRSDIAPGGAYEADVALPESARDLRFTIEPAVEGIPPFLPATPPLVTGGEQ